MHMDLLYNSHEGKKKVGGRGGPGYVSKCKRERPVALLTLPNLLSTRVVKERRREITRI